MMDLIERYLGAVRWNLPAGKTADIIAELREMIESRVEDREEAKRNKRFYRLSKDGVGVLAQLLGEWNAISESILRLDTKGDK